MKRETYDLIAIGTVWVSGLLIAGAGFFGIAYGVTKFETYGWAGVLTPLAALIPGCVILFLASDMLRDPRLDR